MKKLLSIFMMVCMMVTFIPIAGGGALMQSVVWADDGTDYTDTTSGLKYRLYTDGTSNTATVTAYTGSATELTIPGMVEKDNETYTVTSIEDHVFGWNSNIKKITIPGSIRNIRERLFVACDALETLIIENGVESIGEMAFMSCLNLKSVTIPSSVRKVGKRAFTRAQSIDSFTIDENNPYLSYEDGVLYNRDKSTLILLVAKKTGEFTVKDSVERIEEEAFYLSEVTKITIPSSVKAIGERAFFSNNVLEEIVVTGGDYYCSEAGVLFDKEKTTLICYPPHKTGDSYIIPNSVTSISEQAFCRCAHLESLTIPGSVEVIKDETFNECNQLKTLTISEGVKKLEDETFSNCNSNSISIPESIERIGNALAGILNTRDMHDSGGTTIYYGGTKEQWNNLKVTLPSSGCTVKFKQAQLELTGKFDVESRGNDIINIEKLPDRQTPNVAAEYRIAGGKWQDNPTFTGLKSGTEYTFEARYKGTENTTDSSGTVTMGYAPSNSVTAKFTTLSNTSTVVYVGGSTPTVTASMEFNTKDGSIVYDSTSHTLTITPNEGYLIKDVALDGKTVTVTEGVMTVKEIYSLTKISVTFDKKIIPDATGLKLSVKSKKLSSGNVKVTFEPNAVTKEFIDGMKSQGYTVKYRFYRSTKKSSGYKAMKSGTTGIYYNTSGKSGTRYYYKAQIRIYDANGKLVTKTALKNCNYTTRKW